MPALLPTAAQLNSTLDGYISRGWYREALELSARAAARNRDTAAELLVQINLAEAEYNLGSWDEAWERLRALDPLAAAFPICRAGLAQQRAWIAAHDGRADDALHQLARAELRDLPAAYHAEHWFTAAVSLLAAGRLDAARASAVRGEAVAVRPSSRRNALFIRARVAAALGDFGGADSLCRKAAAHSFRTQGGDGLLFWGDLLARLGRRHEAREAWQLAVDRDPQSESAAFAGRRL